MEEKGEIVGKTWREVKRISLAEVLCSRVE